MAGLLALSAMVYIPLFLGLVVIPTLSTWSLTVLLTKSLALRIVIPATLTGMLFFFLFGFAQVFSSNGPAQHTFIENAGRGLTYGVCSALMGMVLAFFFNKLAKKKK